MIFTLFRTCWCYSDAYNTGTQKWCSIAQYSCTSIWDLKYTFSKKISMPLHSAHVSIIWSKNSLLVLPQLFEKLGRIVLLYLIFKIPGNLMIFLLIFDILNYDRNILNSFFRLVHFFFFFFFFDQANSILIEGFHFSDPSTLPWKKWWRTSKRSFSLALLVRHCLDNATLYVLLIIISIKIIVYKSLLTCLVW